MSRFFQVAKEVMELPCYADSMDSLPDSALKWTSAGVVILLQAHYPFKHTGNKEVLIPRGATGSVDGKTIRWHVKVNFYDLAIAEIQQLLQQVTTRTFILRVFWRNFNLCIIGIIWFICC